MIFSKISIIFENIINNIMNNRTGKKSIVDLQFFMKSSEQRDYILGLICADGCISSSDYGIQITLSEKDKTILEEISKLTNVPIYPRIDKRFNCTLYSYRFRNKLIYQYLISIGITPRKTHTLDLKIDLNNHILRGIFDGDGSIFKNSCNNNVINIVSASEKFINQVKRYIEHNDIKISSLKYHNGAYNINIYSQKEINKFYNLIYKDATLYIKRKYISFNAMRNRNILKN